MSEKQSRRKFLESATVAAAGVLVASQAGGQTAAPQAEGKAEKEYKSLGIEKKNQVATIRIGGGRPTVGRGGGGDIHNDLGEVFSDLRGDNSIRVIVLTWADGLPAYPPSEYSRASNSSQTRALKAQWSAYRGVVRTHDAMMAIEKPIVCRVRENTVGFQANIIYASDIIVAREDVFIGDHHNAPVVAPNGKVIRDSPYVVTGDGGAAWVPLYMTPAKAKEYLMLAKPYTAKQLEQMGVINYAVPAAQVDKVVNDIVERLLQTSAHALAWTKRAINQHYVQRVNSSLNSAIAYELLTLGLKPEKALE